MDYHGLIFDGVATFRDLYEYCQCAERNDVGENVPIEKSPNVRFHIYDTKRQMNLVVDDMPIAVFVFDPEDDKVAIGRVDSGGRADYDCMHSCSMHDSIDEEMSIYVLFFDTNRGALVRNSLLEAFPKMREVLERADVDAKMSEGIGGNVNGL